MRTFRKPGITVRAHVHRRRCRSALSVRSLAEKLAHVLSICGMHTASDSTRRSRNTTRQFSACANILLYAHRDRNDLPGVNSATLSVCLGHKTPIPTPACQAGMRYYQFYFGIWYDPAGTRTYDILRERRTR